MLRVVLKDYRWRWGLAAVALAAGLLFIYAVRTVLPPFLVAVVVAYALDPAVEYLHRQGLGRVWAILVVYALVGLLIAALVVFVVPVLVREFAGLAETIPQYVTRVQGTLTSLEQRYERLALPPAIRGAVDRSIGRLEAGSLAAVNSAVDVIIGLFAQVATIVLAPVLTFYMLLDLPRFRRRLEILLPAGSRGEGRAFLRDLDRVMSGFIRGQMIVSLLVGSMTGLLLTVLGVPFAFVLGLISGVTNVIPYFGPFLGAAPGVILAGAVSFPLAVKAALAYLIVQQVEGAVLVPRVMGSTVGLHPLVLIFALLVGGTYLGLAGLLLAVPVAGLLRVTGSYILRWLGGDQPAGGDRSDESPAM